MPVVTTHAVSVSASAVATTCAAWCMPVASAGQTWMPAVLMIGSRSRSAYSVVTSTVGRAASKI
eukprot:4002754-Prorocentrum_lima.AAC.1